MSPAIDRIATALDQPLSFEVVEQPDELHRIDADRIGQALLGGWTHPQAQEQVQMPRLDSGRLERFAQTPNRHPAQPGQQGCRRAAGGFLRGGGRRSFH
jgi:hypothetical protein